MHTFDYLINIHRRPLAIGVRQAWWAWNAESKSSTRYPGDLRLRLVSRAFNLAVLRVFFKYDGVKFLAYRENMLQRLEEHILHDGNRGWDIGEAVRKLDVVLGTERYRPFSIFDKDHEPKYAGRDDEAETLKKGSHDLKILLEKRTLSRLVQRMPRLESLIVHLPEEWRSECPDEVDDYDSEDDEGQYGEQYDLDLLHALRSDIASIFSAAATPLPSPDPMFPPNPLNHLTYLRLTLPCAYDIAHIASCVPSSVASRLRHLYLEIIDGTGPCGDLEYTRYGDMSDDDGDGCLYSNLQHKHPNETHFPALCTFVSRCTHLSSLALVGTQCIDLATLVWRPETPGLQNVFLSRVTCTAELLISLLSPPSGEPSAPGAAPGFSPIETLQLENVRLWSGTWKSVFEHLTSAAQHLMHIRVYNVIYDPWGESGHLEERNGRPWENVDVVWTEDEGERKSLAKVIRGVQEGGWEVEEYMRW